MVVKKLISTVLNHGKDYKDKQPGALQMKHWFLTYHGKEESVFTGKEIFTLFDHLDIERQNMIAGRTLFNKGEIPVLFLMCGEDVFIINTTERFIRISAQSSESVYYTDFKGHAGYKTLAADKYPGHIKKDGYFQEFGIRLNSDEVIYWTIPTGKPGFAFWNVTKKCELIGKRYVISPV